MIVYVYLDFIGYLDNYAPAGTRVTDVSPRSAQKFTGISLSYECQQECPCWPVLSHRLASAAHARLPHVAHTCMHLLQSCNALLPLLHIPVCDQPAPHKQGLAATDHAAHTTSANCQLNSAILFAVSADNGAACSALLTVPPPLTFFGL